VNGALLRKTARDAFWMTLGACVLLFIFEILYVRIVSQFAPDLIMVWRRATFLRTMLQALVSIDVAQTVSLNSLVTLGFVHPLLLIVLCAVVVTATTKATVAEIDRGTADLLLTLPISRTRIYFTTSVVWIAAGALIGLCVWCGVMTGAAAFLGDAAVAPRQSDGSPPPIALDEPIRPALMLIPLTNLYALYLAVGATTMLIATFLRRRGVAVAVILSILLFSFLMNFLEPLLPAVKPLGKLGFLHYYRPVDAVRDAAWPVGNIAVLLTIAVAAWTAGLVRFSTRDVPAG
jgi:hypothetical protein